MKLLLDTHLLIWTAAFPARLPRAAIDLVADRGSQLLFSVVSIWEIAIKRSMARLDVGLEPTRIRRMLLDNGYEEIAISGQHALSIEALPQIHKDPFDRMLVAQAAVEGALLLTSDRKVARYPGMIQLV